MTDQVAVRKLREYWDKYILDRLNVYGGRLPDRVKEEIRNQLVDAFRKEMFDLMAFRMKVDDLRAAPETESNRKKVESVVRETFKRWNTLCAKCQRFRETRDIIRPEDLNWEEAGRDASEQADYNEDDVGEDGLPMEDEE